MWHEFEYNERNRWQQKSISLHTSRCELNIRVLIIYLHLCLLCLSPVEFGVERGDKFEFLGRTFQMFSHHAEDYELRLAQDTAKDVANTIRKVWKSIVIKRREERFPHRLG